MRLRLPNTIRRVLRQLGRAGMRAVNGRTWRTGVIGAPTTRAIFLAQINGKALEIGPFDNPQLHGADVSYFDVLDQAGLAERAQEQSGHQPEKCPKIDYVSPVGDLSVVDEQFSAVFSSHVIEHQPDLISHLNGIADILRPGGRYFLIVPDKRFCFDYFTADSREVEIVTAYKERHVVHTADAVRLHWLHLTHNDPLLHWFGVHGRPGSFNYAPDKAIRDARRAESGEYVDVHSWRFTPHFFYEILQSLYNSGLTRLRPTHVNDTMFGEMEFFAILEANRST